MTEFNKSRFLKEISQAVESNLVSRMEIEQVLAQSSPLNPTKNRLINWSYPKILGLIGGLIVFLGVVFLVSLYWGEMNDLTQVTVTLGVGILAYICGNLLTIGLKEKFVGLSIHLIAGLMLPFGVIVLLSKIFPDSDNSRAAVLLGAVVFGLTGAVYLATDRYLKSNLFTVFTSFFGTLAYWLTFSWLVWDYGPVVSDWRLWAWLICSLVYVLVGRWLEDGFRKPTGVFLYWVGNFSILASLFGLLVDRGIWEILYVFVLSIWFYLSTVIKSIGFLVPGAVFLVVYLLYFNGRYFWNTLGWPVGLILSGFILIGASYGAVVFNKRLVAKSKA
jgi:hypothetical protein